MRKLTTEEQNKVKNLQVSNSIYRKDIKKLVGELDELNPKLEAAKELEKTLVGEAHAECVKEITQLEATIGARVGKIKYIEGRIAEKENAIDQIRNRAVREEETVSESYDPNDPDRLAKMEAEKAAKEAAKAARSASRNKRKKSEEPAAPPSEEF